jgi:hypothetical protein
LRARSLVGADRTAEAVQEAEQAAATKQPAMLYGAARVCALASAAAKDNAKLREQYAARAVELLRQAAAKGYKDIEHLKKDDDFKPLRDRADYKTLLNELSGQP